ncbi:MAG: hypothetical protein E7637_01315 [Ruminococcaceae bacterium]|nr:hypothetical protein [Oscillospiraceae bacterium]
MQEQVKKQSGIECSQPTKARGTAWRARLTGLSCEAIWTCAGWLLGQAELPFGTFPLGLALLCATRLHLLSVLLGLLAASVMQMQSPVLYAAVYIAVVLIRLTHDLLTDSAEQARTRRQMIWDKLCPTLTNPSLVGQTAVGGVLGSGIAFRASVGALAALAVSLWRAAVGGFPYYDLFAAVFCVAAVPMGCLFFSLATYPSGKKTLSRRIGELVLLTAFVRAAISVWVFGLPLAPILALTCTLSVTERDGLPTGAVCGILLGLVYKLVHAPAYLLAALLYGMLGRSDKNSARTLIACLGAFSWILYIDGITALVALTPICLLGGLGFGIASRLRLTEARPESTSCVEFGRRCAHADGCHRGTEARPGDISEAFSSLSEDFYNLSDRFRRPGMLDLRRICDRSFDRFCTSCPNQTVCWGLEYSDTLGTVNRLTSALHTKGRVSVAQIPAPLMRRCESVSEILRSINEECAKLTGELLGRDRAELFSMDAEAAASIVNDALEEEEGEYRYDHAEEQRISEYLSDAGVRARGVTVYGKRRRQIVIRDVDIENARVTVDTMRADLGELCGMRLGKPIFELDGRVSTMSLRASKKLSVTGAKSHLSADGEICGDTVNLFSNKKDYFYALICDGMGAGREAAETSSLCSIFLEKMLKAGNRANTSLRMLNNVMCARSVDNVKECSSTVDLLELDLMTGEGCFIKSGAAPSFVIRNGVVQRLQCGSAPIGIISGVTAQKTPCSLRAGDVVIMVSDGILQDDPSCEWLISYLERNRAKSPSELVSRICRHACEGERHDDCSAVAICIHAAEE